MQEIAIILSSLAGVATAAIARRIPREKKQAGKTVLNSRVKSQITSLQVERDILNKIITRLYKDSPDITNAQKDKLLSKYQYQLKIVLEKIDRFEQAREHPDFNLVSDSLAALMDQRLSKLDDRLDEISAKMQTSKQEMSVVKQDRVVKTGEPNTEEEQKLDGGVEHRDVSKKPKVTTKQKEAESLKDTVPQPNNSQAMTDKPKVDSQRKVGTSVAAAAVPAATAPVLPKVDSQRKVGTSVAAAVPVATAPAATTATAVPVATAPAAIQTATTSATAVPVATGPATAAATAVPVLPKANNQGKVGTLPEIEDTQKPIPPIETQIIEKVPEQNTDDKTQIIQTMVPKPKKPIEKIPTPIVMPEPAIVMDPDKTGTTTSEPFLGEDPSTTNIEFDDDGEGDMENLDKIKKDIANIMTKLDQAEVE